MEGETKREHDPGEEDGAERKAPSMEDLIRDWDGLSVVAGHDRETESWFFIALHDATLGPPTGGCRMRLYPRPEEGLRDALRLARGMTLKFAGAGLEFGGGKSVIALSRPVEGEHRTGLLKRFGHLLEALNGAYWAGEDMGTTPEDMALLSEVTRFVHGVQDSKAVDPGPYTARGVLAGIHGAARHTFGSRDLEGREVLVQGVGDVGAPLARMLREEGAHLLVNDLDEERGRQLAREVEGDWVGSEAVYSTPCDIFAPCAAGGVLNQRSIPLLQCRLVAGAANNQLEDEEQDAQRLLDRAIVHAPDFILSAGGAIALILLARGRPEAEIQARIFQIESRTRSILSEARSREQPPQTWATEKVLREMKPG